MEEKSEAIGTEVVVPETSNESSPLNEIEAAIAESNSALEQLCSETDQSEVKSQIESIQRLTSAFAQKLKDKLVSKEESQIDTSNNSENQTVNDEQSVLNEYQNFVQEHLLNNSAEGDNSSSEAYQKIITTQFSTVLKIKQACEKFKNQQVVDEVDNFATLLKRNKSKFKEEINPLLKGGNGESSATTKITTKTKKKRQRKKDDSDDDGQGTTVKTMPAKMNRKGPTIAIQQQENTNEKGVTQRKANTQLYAATVKKQEEGSAFDFYKKKRIICSEIFDTFKEEYAANKDAFIKRVTKNQVVKKVDHKNFMSLESVESIKKYIEDSGYNYNIIEDLSKIAQGGEAQIFRLKVIQPVETVVKIPVQQEQAYQTALAMYGILMESHLLKLIAHKEYIAEILEEIIEYNEKEKSVQGCVVIVEQAQNDLNDILGIWNDKQQSRDRQEKFSLEKLAYFCLKAIEAMNYLHSRKVYFGDMKPQNLLVFRDLTVKLGDFGVSIKFPDDSKPDDTFTLRGLTHQFSMKEIIKKYLDEEPVTLRELIQNDYHSLWKTFNLIHKQFLSKIPDDCFFAQMVGDLKNLNFDTFNLAQLLSKWKRTIAMDDTFILDLCDQMVEEDKIKAIPNILKLSKYKNLFLDLFDEFQEKEEIEFTYVQEKQYQEIEEDQEELADFENKILDEENIYAEVDTEDVDFIKKEIQQVEKYLSKLFYYKDPLDHNFYKQTIYKYFYKYYQIVRERSDIWRKPELFTDQKLKNIFKENKEWFKRYSTFYFFTSYDINDACKLEVLIKLAENYELKELHLQFLKRYIQSYYLFDEQNKTNRYRTLSNYCEKVIELSKELEEDNFSAIECCILTLIHGFYHNEIDNSDYKKIIEVMKSFKGIKLAQYESFYSKLFQAKALYEEKIKKSSQESIIKYLQKERQLYSKFFGEQGEDMSRNAYTLYEAYKKLPSDDQSLYYLQKVATYSRIEKKMVYAFKLTEYYKTRNQKNKLIETLKLFQKIDPLLYFILFYYYEIPNEIPKQERMKCILILRIESEFKYLKESYIDKITIFQKGLLILFGKKKKSYSRIMTYYKKWCQRQELKEFETFNIKKYIQQSNPTEFVGIKEDDFHSVSIIYPNGTKYEGSIRYWKLEGSGTLTFFDQREYTGEFANNKMHGQGRFQFPDGQQCDCTFENGQLIFGVIPQPNGDEYKGEIKDMKYNGKGILTKANGDTYDGLFNNNEFISGNVTITLDENSNYKGEYSENKQNGSGRLQKGENWYEGDFKADRFVKGKVYIKNENGDIYEGDYENNAYKGDGKLIDSKGDEYVGRFENNRFLTGKVKIKSENGDVYEGDYTDNKKIGKGRLTFKNGHVYEGGFSNNMMNGKGLYTISETERYDGVAKDDEFMHNIVMTGDRISQKGFKRTNKGYLCFGEFKGNAFVKGRVVDYEVSDGGIYSGEMENGVLTGEGFKKFSNGIELHGTWVKDKLNGPGFKIYQNGIKLEVEYKENQIQGKINCILGNGERLENLDLSSIILANIELSTDKFTGERTVTKENGDVWEGYFENGILKDGKLKQFEYEGEISHYQKHGKGKLIINTHSLYEGEFQKDMFEGNGKLIRQYYEYEGSFSKNLFHGEAVIKFKNQSVFKGVFTEGVGIGELETADGKKFEGKFSSHEFYSGIEIVNEKAQGEGILIKDNGDFFEGTFENGLLVTGKCSKEDYEGEIRNYIRHGFGTAKNFFGKDYEGEWQNDKYHGKGIIYYYKDVKLECQFKDGLAYGEGILTMYDGEVFKIDNLEEEFICGVRAKNRKDIGKTVIREKKFKILYGMFNNGQLVDGWQYDPAANYEGFIASGKKSGQGQEKQFNYIYQGEFKEGQKSGEGMQRYKLGQLYKGKFDQNDMHGEGSFTLSDGTTYEGEFSRNKMSGKVKVNFANGLKAEGEFQSSEFYQGYKANGKYQGKGILFTSNLEFKQGIFQLETFEDGYKEDLSSKGYIIQGKKNGYGSEITQEKFYEGNYADDQYQGYGSLIQNSKTDYFGEFTNNLYHGKGSLIFKEGLRINATFVEGNFIKAHSVLKADQFLNGIEVDDQVFCGLDFTGNNFTGQGFCLLNEESYFFEGSFINKLINGEGIVRNFEGKSKTLLFDNFEMGGYNLMTEKKLPSGVMYPSGRDKPEGVRKWTPYSQWELTDLIHATEHALCYVPKEEVEIVGWSCFKIYNDSATFHRVTFFWKLYDENNTSLISEGEISQMDINYDKFKPDDKKMIFYNFTTDATLSGGNYKEPIKVSPGQHFHMKLYLYSPSYYEKWCYGLNGTPNGAEDNMDGQVFEVMNSNRFDCTNTTFEKGCIPYILYQFV